MRADKPVKGDKGNRKRTLSKSQPRKHDPGKESKPDQTLQDELLANIKSLGGNEEDYKLVKDLSSGDEGVEAFEGKDLNVSFSCVSYAPFMYFCGPFILS